MSWIKRNLLFVIGSVVAVALLGLAGFYSFTKFNLNNENLGKLDAAYKKLESIMLKSPNAGNEKVPNIDIAKQQTARVRAVADRAHKSFLPVPSIPDSTNITDQDFNFALSRTIKQLTDTASSSSVTLLPKYNFSFDAQVSRAIFTSGSLGPLSQQLGEVSNICRVLFDAKVNALYNLRRERTAGDTDTSATTSENYLDDKSVTNELAVLTPYEVRFACFSAELANVLAGFANAPHGFIVKSMNVEPDTTAAASSTFVPIDNSAFIPGGGNPQPAAANPSPSASTGNSQWVLNEKRLRVTMILEIVKLQTKK